jgi:hypothetical protein
MGCLFKCLDPGPPDDSVRHFWHIRGLLLDAIAPCSSGEKNNGKKQQKQKNDNSTLCVQESGGGSSNSNGGGSGGGSGRTKGDEKEIDGGLIPKIYVQVCA